MRMNRQALVLSILLLSLPALPANADTIVVGPGAFTNPALIDFESFLYVGQVPINNQYAGLGVTFSNFWSDPGDGYLLTGGGLVAAANFNPGVGCQGNCQPSDIILNLPGYTLAGFQIWSNSGVADVTVTTGAGTFGFAFTPARNVFIGFFDPSGIQSIHIDPSNGQPNIAMVIDNVLLEGAVPEGAVPEPTTILLLGSGLTGLVGYRLRRK